MDNLLKIAIITFNTEAIAFSNSANKKSVFPPSVLSDHTITFYDEIIKNNNNNCPVE